MVKKSSLLSICAAIGLLLFAFQCVTSSAATTGEPTEQRRARPGNIKHAASDAENKMKKTPLSCKYIRNGTEFAGPIYMTGENGAIKIGEGVIQFREGKYYLTFDAEKFKVKKYAYMTPEERRRKGISDYEYKNKWENKKLGQDFEYSGKFATYEQFGKKWLVLFNGDTESEYAKIEINSVNDDSFELNQDDILVKMKVR